jgi:hypothetical protein
MKLDVDPFPVDMINFEEKRVLVRTNQAATTEGRRVVVSDELRQRLLKPKNLEPGMWKDNVMRKSHGKWRPNSKFLMEKYTRKQQSSVFNWLGRGGGVRGRDLPTRTECSTVTIKGSGHIFDSWRHQPRDNVCQHWEIPHRVNLRYMVGPARVSNWWSAARSHSFPTRAREDDRVSEAIVLVGSVPCPMMHQQEKKDRGPINKKDDHGHEQQGVGHEAKRMRWLSEAGREIVSPSYSKGPRVSISMA